MRSILSWILAMLVFALAGLGAGCVPSESPQEKQAPPTALPMPAPQPAAQPAPQPAAQPAPAPVPAPEQTPEAAPVSEPDSQAPAPETATPESAAGDAQTLSMQTAESVPGAVNASIQVAKVEGKLEYLVTGAFDLAGTISKATPESPEWVFAGNVTFPTSGYSIHQLYSTGQPETNGTILVFVPVSLPAVGAAVNQEPETHSFELKIPGGNEAAFVATFTNP